LLVRIGFGIFVLMVIVKRIIRSNIWLGRYILDNSVLYSQLPSDIDQTIGCSSLT
jgi:hypothetical protein